VFLFDTFARGASAQGPGQRRASGGQAQDSVEVVLEQAALDAVARARRTNLSIAVSDGARDPLLL
jgi:hypothetical protein